MYRPNLKARIFLLAFSCAAATPVFAWRSALYPVDWNPGPTSPDGLFLHDFSYAGYRNSEVPVPVVAGTVFDVVTGYGADPAGVADSTAAIQTAIDDAKTAGGGIVFFPAGLFKCDGKLVITGDNIVLRGLGPAQSRLYFSLADASVTYDGHIRFQGQVQWGADLLLTSDGVNQDDHVNVADASSLSVGDEIAVGWIITPAFIAEHGMTGTWVSFINQWKPVHRRRITHIQGTAVFLDVPLRYPCQMRDSASIRPVVHSPTVHGYLIENGVEDLGIANANDSVVANTLNQVQAILFRDCQDGWVRNVESFASPHPLAAGRHLQSGGINMENCNRMTVMNCRMESPQNRGSGGNGYLFQVSRSNEVLTKDCTAVAGRHNFIQNWDHGTTGCVWLRCTANTGTAATEYHHSIATACLFDSCTGDDSWHGGNRGTESSGAGHSVTQSCFWNISGTGNINSYNYKRGYVIGTAPTVQVFVNIFPFGLPVGTEPVDFTEGLGQGATLEPQSLFEDQLARRLINAVPGRTSALYE